MITFKELKDKFDADVAELQARCPHMASDWIDSEWAPGHYGDKMRVCLSCDKRMESRSGVSPKSVTCHYEERGDGIYVVWDGDFPGDTPGSRKLRPDEITDEVKAIMEKKWKWSGSND